MISQKFIHNGHVIKNDLVINEQKSKLKLLPGSPFGEGDSELNGWRTELNE